MAKVIEQGEEELETHFVDNPYIMAREKAKLGGSAPLKVEDLEEDDREIYYVKESGKMFVQDLEKEDKKKGKKNDDDSDSDTDEEDRKLKSKAGSSS